MPSLQPWVVPPEDTLHSTVFLHFAAFGDLAVPFDLPEDYSDLNCTSSCNLQQQVRRYEPILTAHCPHCQLFVIRVHHRQAQFVHAEFVHLVIALATPVQAALDLLGLTQVGVTRLWC
jgi:hypothetical protein